MGNQKAEFGEIMQPTMWFGSYHCHALGIEAEYEETVYQKEDRKPGKPNTMNSRNWIP